MATPLLAEFPELSHLSREDLEDLLTDPTYFESVFHSLPRVVAMFQAQNELGMANESIAKNNLAMEEGLYRLRRETQEAFDEAKALETRWRVLEREQKDVYQRFTPQFLLMRLRHATTAQDDASEALASSFVKSSAVAADINGLSTGNGREVDEFIKEFKDARTKYHRRAMWAERWTAGQVAWRDD